MEDDEGHLEGAGEGVASWSRGGGQLLNTCEHMQLMPDQKFSDILWYFNLGSYYLHFHNGCVANLQLNESFAKLLFVEWTC